MNPSNGPAMHHPHLDLLGIVIAGTLAASPGWLEHAMAYMPTPTAFYAVCGSVFLIVQTLDKLGLLPRFGRHKRKD